MLWAWLAAWEEAGRPAPETYTLSLVRYDDDQGTSGRILRLTQPCPLGEDCQWVRLGWIT